MMLRTHIEQKLYEIQRELRNVLENLLFSSVVMHCCLPYVSVEEDDILQELNDIINSIPYFTIINRYQAYPHYNDAEWAYSRGSHLFAFHTQPDYDFYYLVMASTSSDIHVHYLYGTTMKMSTVFQEQFPTLAAYVINSSSMIWGSALDTVGLKKNTPYTALIEAAKGARDKRFIHTFSHHFEKARSIYLIHNFLNQSNKLRENVHYNTSLFQMLIICMNTEKVNEIVVKSQLLTLLNQDKCFFSAKNDLINLFLSIPETIIPKEKKLAMAKVGTLFSVLIDFNRRSRMWKSVMTAARERVNNALGVQDDPQYCRRLKEEKSECVRFTY